MMYTFNNRDYGLRRRLLPSGFRFLARLFSASSVFILSRLHLSTGDDEIKENLLMFLMGSINAMVILWDPLVSSY